MLALLLACDPPTPARTSTLRTDPSDEVVETEVPLGEASRPDGRRPVADTRIALEELPGLGLEALDGRAATKAHYLLNTSVGACAPCMERGLTLAACALRAPEGCENVPALVRRLVRLAPERHPDEIRPLIDYAEPWLPMPAWLRGEAPLTVVFAVDYESPFCLRAQGALDALLERYGERIELRLLHAPDAERHPRAEAAAAAVLRAGEGAGELHRSLLAHYAELDEATIARLADEAGVNLAGEVEADLARHREAAEALGVRGTPTVFLDGYLFRGMRPAAAYVPHVDALLADAGVE